MAGEIYPSTFTKNELITGDKAIISGEITRIGAYKIQAGEEISFGSGQLAGQDNATGRIYMDLRDNAAAGGAALSGNVRLVVYSSQNRPLEIVREFRTEDLATSATVKAQQTPFTEHAIWAREDQLLVLEFIPDAGVSGTGSGTLGKANSKILVSVTKKAL